MKKLKKLKKLYLWHNVCMYVCVCVCVCVGGCIHIYLMGFTDPKVVIVTRYLSNCELIDCVQV